MKKYFLSFASLCVMVVMACLMAISVSSCGGDDDGDPTPPEKATSVIIQPGAYVSVNTLKYFDVVVTEADGSTVTLTEENTEPASAIDFGSGAKYYGPELYRTITGSNDQVRLYKSGKTTIKNFPAIFTFKVEATLNGTEPAEGKMNAVIVTDADITNNLDKLSSFEFSSSQTVTVGARYDKFTEKYKGVKKEINLTVSDAQSVSGSLSAGFVSK